MSIDRLKMPSGYTDMSATAVFIAGLVTATAGGTSMLVDYSHQQ